MVTEPEGRRHDGIRSHRATAMSAVAVADTHRATAVGRGLRWVTWMIDNGPSPWSMLELLKLPTASEPAFG